LYLLTGGGDLIEGGEEEITVKRLDKAHMENSRGRAISDGMQELVVVGTARKQKQSLFYYRQG